MHRYKDTDFSMEKEWIQKERERENEKGRKGEKLIEKEIFIYIHICVCISSENRFIAIKHHRSTN